MKTESIFLFFLATMLSMYAIRSLIMMSLDRKVINKTQGKVINIELVLPEIMMNRNAKLVTFEYYVDGKKHVSKNKVKMPLSAEVGDTKDIRYYINKPNTLYTRTNLHFYIPMAVSLICFLLGFII